MAKSKSFFGLRRGSTKTLTFSVLDGQQITKDRVSEVKNPRTEMQMEQRCKLKTVSLAYSALKSIVDHSFEGITYGGMSMRQFSRINYPLVKAASKATTPTFGFASFKSSAPAMGQYVIAQGSLTRPSLAKTVLTSTPSGFKIEITTGDAMASVLSNLGVNVGELYTVCALVQDSVGNVQFVWVRFSLPTEGSTINKDNLKVESNVVCNADITPTKWTIQCTTPTLSSEGNKAILYDVIRSAMANGGWARSSAKLSNVVGTVKYVSSYADAVATYPVGNSYILNDGEVGLTASTTNSSDDGGLGS